MPAISHATHIFITATVDYWPHNIFRQKATPFSPHFFHATVFLISVYAATPATLSPFFISCRLLRRHYYIPADISRFHIYAITPVIVWYHYRHASITIFFFSIFFLRHWPRRHYRHFVISITMPPSLLRCCHYGLLFPCPPPSFLRWAWSDCRHLRHYCHATSHIDRLAPFRFIIFIFDVFRLLLRLISLPLRFATLIIATDFHYAAPLRFSSRQYWLYFIIYAISAIFDVFISCLLRHCWFHFADAATMSLLISFHCVTITIAVTPCWRHTSLAIYYADYAFLRWYCYIIIAGCHWLRIFHFVISFDYFLIISVIFISSPPPPPMPAAFGCFFFPPGFARLAFFLRRHCHFATHIFARYFDTPAIRRQDFRRFDIDACCRWCCCRYCQLIFSACRWCCRAPLLATAAVWLWCHRHASFATALRWYCCFELIFSFIAIAAAAISLSLIFAIFAIDYAIRSLPLIISSAAWLPAISFTLIFRFHCHYVSWYYWYYGHDARCLLSH